MARVCFLHIHTIFRKRPALPLWLISDPFLLYWKFFIGKKENQFARSNRVIHCHEFAPASESASQDEASEATDTGNSRVTQGRGMGECCGVALFFFLPCWFQSFCEPSCARSPACVWRTKGMAKGPIHTVRRALFDCCPLTNAKNVKLHLLRKWRKYWPRVKTKRENPGEEVGLPVCVSVSRLTQVHRITARLISEVTWS